MQGSLRYSLPNQIVYFLGMRLERWRDSGNSRSVVATRIGVEDDPQAVNVHSIALRLRAKAIRSAIARLGQWHTNDASGLS
jgi:hypothetical protein